MKKMKQPKTDSTGNLYKEENLFDSTEDVAKIFFQVVYENKHAKDYGSSSSSGERLPFLVNNNSVIIGEKQKKTTFKKTFEFLSEYKNQNQADQAKTIVTLIKDAIELHENITFPEIVFFEIDEKSLGMQWDYRTFTFGVGFEEDISDSYWFMLGGQKDKSIKARGSLENIKILKYYIRAMVEQ